MISASILPRETSALVDAELRPGERIAWVGQPIPRHFARKSLVFVLFGIPWTAFAVFWTVSAATMTTLSTVAEAEESGRFQLFDFFPLFGLPFILIGVAMLSSPFWMRRAARRTAYVITDRRVLTLNAEGWRGMAIRSFEPEHLLNLTRSQNSDGSGDITFELQRPSDPEGDKQSHAGFLAILNVKEVEGFIRALIAKTNPRNA